MKEQKFHLDKTDKENGYFYLELRDLAEASVQIWQHADGEKKTFIRIRVSETEWKKFINEHQHFQALQETSERTKI